MVFIHGTILPIPSLECFGSATYAFLTKGRTLKKSWYQIYLDELKGNSLFKYQPNGPDGLCLINEASSDSAQVAATFFNNLYQELYPDVQLSCYTFSWSGRLSHKKRVQAAHDLYRQLMAEIKRLNEKNIHITILGHSHGGNVTLNLAQAENTYHQHLKIDRAILLGTPVQSETQPLLASPIFKSIYHCYSHGDNVQKMDFISTRDDHSFRRFTLDQGNAWTNKVTQIELKLGSCRPGHGELWLTWGKDNSCYRKNLPIFPLPTFVFLPEIIHHLEKTCPNSHDIMVNIDQKDSGYAITVYNDQPDQEDINKTLTVTTLPKKFFTPSIQTILQNEHYNPPQTGIKQL